MQCFRLMNMPDRVIAFDELPERLLVGFELCAADGFPRHWKEWLGKRKRVTAIPPEKDFLTGQVRYFKPIEEEDYFFYLVDWNVNPVMEKWQEVCNFAKQVVPKEFRMLDKIDDMAKPLAANKSDGISLEPEDVVVIPIPLEFQEKKAKLAPEEKPVEKQVEKENVPHGTLSCNVCDRKFEGNYAKTGLRAHMRKHDKVPA